MLVVEVALAESVVFQPNCMHRISRSRSRLLRSGRHNFPGVVRLQIDSRAIDFLA